MDSHLLSGRQKKPILLMAWALIVLSIFSCCSRADYNVICGFLVLLLRSITSGDKYKLGIKGNIHILILALIFDIIWIYQYSRFWRHGEETSDIWKSLSFIHNSVYYVGLLEFLLKFPLIYAYYKQYKNIGGSNSELLSLRYSGK